MDEKGVIFTRNASGLVRELSWWDVFIWVVATPAASAITFYAVSTAVKYPGASMWLSFLIGFIMFFPIYALMGIISASMPRSGSQYVFVSRVLNPTLGYLGGWLFFIGYGIAIGVLGYIAMGIAGGAFAVAGNALKNTALISFGNILGGHLWQTIGAIFWVGIFWAITLKGVKWVRTTMRILIVIPLIATLIGIIYCFAVGPGGVASAFNHTWGAGVFQTILNTSHSKGWISPTFSWGATLSALLVVIWGFTGGESISYVSGEVKTAKTSLIRGYLLGCLAVGVLYILVALAVYYPYKNFIGAYGFLFNSNPEALKEIMPAISPSVPFFVSSLMNNVWLGIIVTVSIALWYVNTIPPLFAANSRLIFAFGMDKALPERLADVNARTSAPTWATHLTAIVALGGVFLMSQSVGVVLGILNFTIFFILWAVGLSAMLLPYLKPEIYDKSPIKGKIWIPILGVITFGEGWFVLIFSTMGFNKGIALVTASVMTIGMLIYLIQMARNKRNNVPVSEIYSQIPPE